MVVVGTSASRGWRHATRIPTGSHLTGQEPAQKVFSTVPSSVVAYRILDGGMAEEGVKLPTWTEAKMESIAQPP